MLYLWQYLKSKIRFWRKLTFSWHILVQISQNAKWLSDSRDDFVAHAKHHIERASWNAIKHCSVLNCKKIVLIALGNYTRNVILVIEMIPKNIKGNIFPKNKIFEKNPYIYDSSTMFYAYNWSSLCSRAYIFTRIYSHHLRFPAPCFMLIIIQN